MFLGAANVARLLLNEISKLKQMLFLNAQSVIVYEAAFYIFLQGDLIPETPH